MPLFDPETGSGSGGAAPRFHDGLGQAMRLRTPLVDGWFRPDELGFEQILTLAREYARLVRFHDDRDRQEGPWEELFSGSEAVVMAEILSVPTSRLERILLEGGPLPENVALPFPRDLLRGWSVRLGLASSAAGSELRSILKGLAAGIDDASGSLSQLEAVRMAQESARRLLPRSLASGDLDPATSLLVAFARIYRRLQDRFDGFAQARSDFHFRQVLGSLPREGAPDFVHLVAPATTGRTAHIHKGTEFVAGTDSNGHPIVYAAQDDTRTGDAQVAKVLTLWTEPAPAHDGSTARGAAGMWIDEPRPGTAHPLFGAGRGNQPARTAQRARTGFLVADPCLLLREGERKVRVTFLYQQGTSPETGWFGRKPTSTQAEERDLESIAGFYTALRDAFRISLTGESGWIPIAEYLPSCPLTDTDLPDNSFSIEFTLAREAGRVVPFSREIHGPDGNTSLPAVRFEIVDRAAPHPLEVFDGLELREILVEVEAKGCRDLVLHNQTGPLSALTPFPLFGPLPTVGSYLVVGNPETQSKEVVDFRLDVRWADLPPGVDDFADWYSGYKDPCPTSGFHAKAGVLSEGRWIDMDLDGDGGIELFRSCIRQGIPAGIDPESTLSFHEVTGFRVPLPAKLCADELRYTPTSQGGFFRLTLSAPTGGFGHGDYPHLLTRSLMKAARLKDVDAAPPPPNPPYTPTIASIALDYRARSRIVFDATSSQEADPHHPRLIHLTPFGWESVSRRSHSRILQLPGVDAPGNLLVGLDASAAGSELGLLFRIADDSKLIRHPERTGLRWWYLVGNAWHPIPPKDIQTDTTGDFGTTGIVRLRIPHLPVETQTIMPSGIVWLRVGAVDYLDHFGHLLSIHAQAIRAVLVDAGDGTRNAYAPVVAGSISAPRQAIANLGNVTQPDPSFGGRSTESDEHHRIRIAERLRHKGRAVEPSDFEQLVLEAFPDVHKVKCFANLRRKIPVEPSPGHVLVVPLPRPDRRESTAEPSLNGAILMEIQKFLESRAGASAKISVCNPWYEKIQVRCAVGFRRDRPEGAMMADLDAAIREWISPWDSPGPQAHFGWRLRRQSLEAFVQDHPDVEELVGLALLRITPRPGRMYGIENVLDTSVDSGEVLAPSYPWSVPSPLPSLITVAAPRESLPKSAGYGGLGIGSTFVITPGGNG